MKKCGTSNLDTLCGVLKESKYMRTSEISIPFCKRGNRRGGGFKCENKDYIK